MRVRLFALSIVLLFLFVSAVHSHIDDIERSPETEFSITVLSGDLAGVTALIEAGVDVNEADSHGHTALMWASICKSKAIADVLIRAGANVELFSKDGYTALHFACEAPHAELEHIKMLIHSGSDVNARADDNAGTPLHSALGNPYGASVDVISVLLDAGADATAVTHCWAPVNQVAVIASKAGSYLENPLIAITIFDLLLAAGADPNHVHCGWGPPIAQAVRTEEVWFVAYLIDVGVDVNKVFWRRWPYDMRKCTALDLANEFGLIEIASSLRAAGAISASETTE